MPPRWVRSGLAGLTAANRALATILFVLLTVVVALQVFTRFVLHVPMIWSEEVARFLFFWVVLLGAAMSVRDRRHFVIDVTAGPARAGGGGLRRFLFDVIPDLCVLAFSALLLLEGLRYTDVGRFRIGTNSQVTMAFVYAAIPVFAVLSALYAAGSLLVDWAAFVQGRGPTPRPPQTSD